MKGVWFLHCINDGTDVVDHSIKVNRLNSLNHISRVNYLDRINQPI
jgi:predicted peptidase